jgi:hypothetical protein
VAVIERVSIASMMHCRLRRRITEVIVQFLVVRWSRIEELVVIWANAGGDEDLLKQLLIASGLGKLVFCSLVQRQLR